MKFLRSIRRFVLRAAGLLQRRSMERDLQDELESNLQMEIEDHLRAGMTSDEARRRVLMKFGGLDSVMEQCRERRGIPFIETIAKDVGFTLRSLRQNKGWTFVAIISLALGIGVNTSLFSLVHDIFLRELPVRNPGELVSLRWYGETNMSAGRSGYGYLAPDPRLADTAPSFREATFSYGVFQEMRGQSDSIAELFAAANTGSVNLFADGYSELASAEMISGNFYRALGISAVRGRLIDTSDDSVQAAPVAVISFQYWQRRFGMDPGVVGRLVTINTVPFTIIGVTPPGFDSVVRNSVARDVTVPLSTEPRLQRQSKLNQPAAWWLMVMGRLRPHARREQLEAALTAVYERQVREEWKSAVARFPAARRSSPEIAQHEDRLAQLRVVPANRGVYDVDPPVSDMLGLLSGIAALVLLLVWTNLSNLLLLRGAARQKEITIRLAIGASRKRLIRQLLTEGLVVAVIGGLVGLLFAYWTRSLFPIWIGFRKIDLGWAVPAFAAAITILSGTVFGLLPAFRSTAVDCASPVRGSSQFSHPRNRASQSVLMSQVAISLVLLIGAGLFVKTLRNLRSVDTGFNTANLILFGVNPQANQYDPARTAVLFENILERLEAIPGVRSAALSSTALLTGDNSQSRFGIEGRPDRVMSYILSIHHNYFSTLDIPLKLGRDFAPADNSSAPGVAIINEKFGRMFFPNLNPLGKHLETGAPPANIQVEIVGIVGDARFATLRDDPPPTVYMPHLQRPTGRYFAVRTQNEANPLIPAIRSVMRDIDPNLPLQFISTQAETMDELLKVETTFAVSSSVFGILALSISMIGLFGLMSYTVARRTKEIAIRIALGASRRFLLFSVMRETLSLVAVGLVIGLIVSSWLNRFAASQLFGLQPYDATTTVIAVIVVTTFAVVAGYLPARRAARIDPMIAIRYE